MSFEGVRQRDRRGVSRCSQLAETCVVGRDSSLTAYLCKAGENSGGLCNVEFDAFPDRRDPGKCLIVGELLVVDELVAGYGESIVLEGISFSLDEGGSLALLGRNGVGKTTLLLTLMGLARLRRGRLTLRGRDLSRMPTYQRALAGLGWAPQERLMFPSLTVEQHLTVVARPGPWGLDRAYQTFPGLAKRRGNFGNQLSGGEQQMLAIARALMTNPSVLLLDEPMEGLAPVVVRDVISVIEDLVHSRELAVIIVEQHARMALSLTKQAIVLNHGRVVYRAPSFDLLQDQPMLDRLMAIA
jgi:branched-chain amino acid transport system ATP-binding protein